MANTLFHRGPDDGGAWVDGGAGVALGHRRLAVLDISPAGRQPMVSASGRFVIVFNGEIYNHSALRRSLDHRNWRGHSDTETLLAAFETWGVEETLKQSVGMFALALWDRQERVLTLARDRMGEKPLYYGWQGNTFLFGSELKALKGHPAFCAEIDRAALTLLLRHGAIPAPHSIYQGIYKLPPGTFLQLRSSRERAALPVPYWSARSVAETGQRCLFRGDSKEAIDHTENLLREAIAGQMVADVPLGAFLSGGIDSSTVVALMQAQSSKPVRTFTIGFTETNYNEADHAQVIARRLGCQHTELYVTPQEAMQVIPQLSTIYDEPFADSSQIPTRLVARMARDQVTVCLTGDGGDEVFGGYDRYLEARKLWRAIGWVPGPLRLVWAAVLTVHPPGVWAAATRILDRWLPAAKRYKHWGYKLQTLSEILSVRSPEEIYLKMMSQWKRTTDVVRNTHEPITVLSDATCQVRLPDFEHRMMYLDTVSYLPDDILAKVDRAAMSVSLETRLPFLDHRVVEFAWRLPLKMKIHRHGKWTLRQVLYRYVPKELVDRPKMGFGLPLGEWLRGPLKSWAEALIEPNRLQREGFLNHEPIQLRWHEHQAGVRDWSYSLWNVLMFQSWLEAQG